MKRKKRKRISSVTNAPKKCTRVHFTMTGKQNRRNSVSHRRKEVTLLNNDMEGSSSHAPNRTATCMGLYTRHLCAVCGALAIGTKIIFFHEVLCDSFYL
jgi:hypothetical protein